jgi:CubicO group peptidase (beta-lactamase class C family)
MKKIYLLIITLVIIHIGNVFSNDVVSNNDTCKSLDSYLSGLAINKNFSGALLITKDGKKIFSKGYGWANKESKVPFTSSTLASMGSITKAFTAAGIMKLVEQGKISLSDPLKIFFATVPPDKADITIHQLLTHSSGFHEFLKDDGGDYEKIETKDFLGRAFDEPLAFKPGEKAVYTNVGMSILAIIIEQVAGMDYESFLKKELFYPTGIKNIGYQYPASPAVDIAVGYEEGKSWGTHQQHFKNAGGGPYWNLKGNGGLEVSLDEMFLWTSAISNHTILSEESVRKLFTAYIPEEGSNGNVSFGYGCTISKSRRNTELIANGGSNGIYFAQLLRLPEEGLIFYMVTNESTVSTNKVLPNVTQLYFEGKITHDAFDMQSQFQNPVSKKIYDLLTRTDTKDLTVTLKKENIVIEDDMILLEVGRKLTEEKKTNEAFLLYSYYTKAFPKIVVAWNDLGDIYRLQNKNEEAIACYQQALKLRPGNERAADNLKKLSDH